jgi:shikimate dehydrogenase
LLTENEDLCGLNVTLPSKEQVLQSLDEIDPVAKKIGAVNVIKVVKGKMMGFNTDSDAFFETLEKWLPKDRTFKGLVLGSGGSSKAVQQALTKLGIEFKVVSREIGKADYSYEEANQKPEVLGNSHLLINTTPLGMHPNEGATPPIDMDNLTKDHYVYDLIYNPARTQFLQKAEMRGAVIKNGLEMLHIQAEKSWSIWNN